LVAQMRMHAFGCAELMEGALSETVSPTHARVRNTSPLYSCGRELWCRFHVARAWLRKHGGTLAPVAETIDRRYPA